MVETLVGSIGSYYKSFYQIVDSAKQRQLVIYGAGYWGKRTVSIFRLFGITPVCMCDDDSEKIGKSLEGINVISLDEAKAKYPGAIYIAAAQNNVANSPRRRMNRKLRERGLLSKESGFHPFRYLFLELIDNSELKISDNYSFPKINDVLILNQIFGQFIRWASRYYEYSKSWNLV